jgi:prolyl-tRNA synthetase
MQVVIVPIWKKGDEKGVVMEAVASVQNTLKEAGIRVKVDDSELRTPGWKFNFYEMKVMTLLLVKLHFQLFLVFFIMLRY